MALKTPVGVKDTTNTSGQGTLTLLDSATPGDGYQTVADAVAGGALSDGDTVYFVTLDDSTEGTSLEYEYTLGTIGNSGTTLTRDTVISNDDGNTTKKNWGAGGTRTVLIVTGNWLLAANNLSELTASASTARANLAAAGTGVANTFVDGQQISGTGGAITALSLVNLQTAAVGNRLLYRYLMKDSAGNTDVYARIEARTEGVTSGAEEGAIDFYVITGGSVARRLILTGSGLRDNSSNKYVAFPTGGSVALGFFSAPPTGWTRQNETSGRLIKLATAADTAGATGGTADPFGGGWATNTHTLLITEVPSHTHSLNGANGVYGKAVVGGDLASGAGGPDAVVSDTGSAGGGGSHAHNMSTPNYRVFVRATFD